MPTAPYLRTEEDLALRNAVFANTPSWIQEKGITGWCTANRQPGCAEKYERESFPGEVPAKGALEIAYNSGYAQGYEGRERRWTQVLRSDLAGLEQAIREGRLAHAELAVDDLGYARGVQERPAPRVIQVIGPPPTTTTPSSSRSILSQLILAAALTSPAWLTIFVLPLLGKRARRS